MDNITQLFQLFDRMFNQLSWKAAFGEPQQLGEKTIIPVAAVTYGFGMGGGSGPTLPDEAEETAAPAAEPAEAAEAPAEASGGGGATTPVALIEVTPQKIVVRPIIHWEKVILAFLFMICWTTFFGTSIARKAIDADKD
jgi:uncharacterized spore protein YtfJ